ncbi:DUF3180 domain-containing protein [Corynebacterium pseudodiphtheriticum]|jgi:hypothetical protein|uniref:DUF3180 domain-containing protein n=1 Tax=Corynebacterium pseudodiphtheriticum TaxID=37637 RepID=UPI000479021C|nr:DUF3180 domain-containing protein [Corynebacterium pseudodiphtheriticum]
MKTTSIPWLVASGGFAAACTAIVAWQLYGRLPAVPLLVAVSLWAMVLVCVMLGRRVSKSRDDHGIGLDRSQLDPLTAARYLVFGQASAWTGAILGGGYAGIASYVIPKSGELLAASEDLPVVVAAALGGLALAAAGAYLERACQTPMPPKASF